MYDKPFYIDAVDKGDTIHCWTRDRSNKLTRSEYPVSDYCYCFHPMNGKGTPEYWDIYGNPLKKVSFDNARDFRDYAKKNQNLFESDVPVVTKFLLENYSDGDFESPVNIAFYDIEVDFNLQEGTGYPTPKNPFGEITSFSLFDVHKQRYIMLINEKHQKTVTLKDDTYPVDTIWCRNEREMILEFVDVIEDIDVLAGWNVDTFDLPYIMERAFMHFSEDRVLEMFCRDGFKANRRDFVNAYLEEVWKWILVGRQHVDMLDLYKKFVPGMKSFKLDNVVRAEIGEEKIDFEDDLGTLYRENPQKYFDYSLHDSRLLKKLNDKLQIVEQAVLIARTSCVKMSAVVGSVTPIETELMKFCRKKGNIILPDKKENVRRKFKGAIVYDTIQGRHGMGFTVDLGSLYPSVMVTLGLSPETLVMQCEGYLDDYVEVMQRSKEDITVELRDGDRFVIPADELHDIILQNGYTISANGTIFSGELGILAEFVEYGLKLRSQYRKQADIEMDAGNIDGFKLFTLRQKVTKTRNNSVYGVTGEPSFRLFDLRLSESITISGQLVSKHQAVAADRMLDEYVAMVV